MTTVHYVASMRAAPKRLCSTKTVHGLATFHLFISFLVPPLPSKMPREIKRRNRDETPTVPHTPRPANSFIIFRSDKLRNTIPNPTLASRGPKRQKDLSHEAAAAWKNLDLTTKQLYDIQAKIIKNEHSSKFPGWTYKPRRPKKGEDGGGPPKKRAARATAPRQESSVDATEAEREVATHLTGDSSLVWDSSWFSGRASMVDPFYSTPLQPLALASIPSNF